MCLLIFLFKAMLPLLLVLLYIIISIATRQNEGWIATGSWENGNEMESSTWNNNMQITLAYDQQQRKWCFFGKTAYLVFGMHSFFFSWQLLFLVTFLAFFFFFFETKIKSLKNKNSTWHCMWLSGRCSDLCASRDSSWAEHLESLLIGKWTWLLIKLTSIARI